MRHCLILLLTLFSMTLAQADNESVVTPVGYWKTIDDVNGQPRSIIQISEDANHALTGKVVKIFPKEGSDQHKLCVACEGKNHNQPIVGMVILSGLTSAETQWENGKIIDTVNGKSYRCIAKPYVDGKRLLVRGYVGLPLLGRSQVWQRVDQQVI